MSVFFISSQSLIFSVCFFFLRTCNYVHQSEARPFKLLDFFYFFDNRVSEPGCTHLKNHGNLIFLSSGKLGHTNNFSRVSNESMNSSREKLPSNSESSTLSKFALYQYETSIGFLKWICISLKHFGNRNFDKHIPSVIIEEYLFQTFLLQRFFPNF